MFSFGTFAHGETLSWSAWELPFFIAVSGRHRCGWCVATNTRVRVHAHICSPLACAAVQLGAAAGLLGAGFIALQHKISLFRLKYVPVSSPHLRVVEVAVLIVFKIVLEFVLAVAVNECRPRPIDSQYSQYLQSFYCDSASYNELASFFMVPSEVGAITPPSHAHDRRRHVILVPRWRIIRLRGHSSVAPAGRHPAAVPLVRQLLAAVAVHILLRVPAARLPHVRHRGCVADHSLWFTCRPPAICATRRHPVSHYPLRLQCPAACSFPRCSRALRLAASWANC